MPGPDLSHLGVVVGAAAAGARGPDLSGKGTTTVDLPWWSPGGIAAAINGGLPFAKEAAEGADSIKRLATGQAKDLGDAWRQAEAFQNTMGASYTAQHPRLNSFFRGVGGAAQVLPAIASGGASAAPAATAAAKGFMPRVAAALAAAPKLATTGAAYGAVNGMGDSEGSTPTTQQRAEGGQTGALTGGLLGVAIPAGLGAAGMAARTPFARAAGATFKGSVIDAPLEAAKRAMFQQPLESTPQQVDAVMPKALDYVTGLMQENGGKSVVTTAEAIGPTAEQVLVRLSRRPGATGAAARKLLTGRAANALNRFSGDVESNTHVSPDLARNGIDTLVRLGQAEVKPMYEKAFESGAPVMNADLAAMAQETPVQKAIDQARTLMRTAGIPDAAPGFHVDPDTGLEGLSPEDYLSLTPRVLQNGGVELQPTLRAWDLVKKTMDRQVERDQTGQVITSGNRGSENDLRQLAAQRLTGNLRALSPDYAAALDRAQEYLAAQDAYNTSGNMLSNNWSAKDVADYFSRLPTDAEKHAVKLSFANQLYDQIDKGTLRPSVFRGYGGGQKAAIADKISTVFSPSAADNLGQSADWEEELQRIGGRMQPGQQSITTEGVGATPADADASTAAANRAAMGDVSGAVKAGLFSAWKRMAEQPGSVPLNDAVGQLLLMRPADFSDAVVKYGGGSGPVPFLPNVTPQSAPVGGLLGGSDPDASRQTLKGLLGLLKGN
jgi:hypothetical protein